MRPNAIRPVVSPRLSVEDVTEAERLFSIKHEQPENSGHWELYRKLGETRDRCSLHETHNSHHVLVDRNGSKWRICFRCFAGLASAGTIRRVRAVSPEAKPIIQMVQTGEIDWPEALQALHELGPLGDEERSLPSYEDHMEPVGAVTVGEAA